MLFLSSRRRHTRWPRDWSSDVCSSDLQLRIEVTEVDGLRIETVHVMVEAAASQEDADSGDHNGHDSRAGRESSEPRGDSREEPRSDGEAAEPETSWGQRRPRTEHEVDPDDGGLSARSLRREGQI